ncbi:hypothetical protein BDR03DRAFT_952353 [Suillus americanus]|nr:hypothetical protein BDR03DRAFT_952353 [Suillus americanus]
MISRCFQSLDIHRDRLDARVLVVRVFQWINNGSHLQLSSLLLLFASSIFAMPTDVGAGFCTIFAGTLETAAVAFSSIASYL